MVQVLLQAIPLPTDALTLGRDALLILLVLDKVVALVKLARGKNGSDAKAGAETTDKWERFIVDACIKANERTTRLVVMPVLSAIQGSCNQTQSAVQEIAKVLAIMQEIEERKSRDQAITEAADRAAVAARAGKAS